MTNLYEWQNRFRSKIWSFPYQNYNPFNDNDIVEVGFNNTTETVIGKSNLLWWGYETELGEIGEGVITKARLAILTKEEVSKLKEHNNSITLTRINSNIRYQKINKEEWPNHIWLQNQNNKSLKNLDNETTWSLERIFDNDILYIRDTNQNKNSNDIINSLNNKIQDCKKYIQDLIDWFDAENAHNPLEKETIIPTYKLRQDILDNAIKFMKNDIST
jgi:hypothetical protein